MSLLLALLTLSPPSLADEATDRLHGTEAGIHDARRLDLLRPTAAGAGAGLVVAGGSVFFVGVLGLPCAAGSVGGSYLWARRQGAPAPPPGPWLEQSETYQDAYRSAFAETAAQRQRRAALIGSGAGAGLATLAAFSALYVIDDAVN